MSEPYIGEIRVFGCSFTPYGWLVCAGQTLAIQQFSALYAVISSRYGGNGTTNFAVPNLQALAVMGAGTGPGLTPNQIGHVYGQSTISLTPSQLPSHSHGLVGQNLAGNQTLPQVGAYLANDIRSTGQTNINITVPGTALNPNSLVPMAANALGGAGADNPSAFDNHQPWLGMNFCIAWDGIFPVRAN